MSRKTLLTVCCVLAMWTVLLRWSLGSDSGAVGDELEGIRHDSQAPSTARVHESREHPFLVGQSDTYSPSQQLPPSLAAIVPPRAVAQLSASCVQTVQDSVSSWLSCVDASVPASAPSLKWLRKSSAAACSFRDHSAFDDPVITQLFLSHAVEAHGDSTLREMLKLLVHGLRMAGSLEKKDASATLRSPKYFSREFSNCSAGFGGIPVPLMPQHGKSDGEHRRVAGVALALWDAGALRGVDPVAFRVMFRFDFVPSSFVEPLRGTVPTTASDSRVCSRRRASSVAPSLGPPEPVSFFDRDASWRVLLLATGSHTAKSLLMNQSTYELAKHIVADKSSSSHGFAADRIFELVIADMETYLLKRLLGLRVVRTQPTSLAPQQKAGGEREGAPEQENQVRLVREETGGDAGEFNTPDRREDDPALQPVHYAVVFLEALECGKMGESNLQGFKDMAMFCGPMEQFLMKINDHIAAHFSSPGNRNRSGERLTRSGWHRRSALWKLDGQQAEEFFSRLVVVPPLLCHDKGRHFQYSSSKPFCTRDGIHLRTRFIRLKLSLLFNIMSKMRSCATNSSDRLSWW